MGPTDRSGGSSVGAAAIVGAAITAGAAVRAGVRSGGAPDMLRTGDFGVVDVLRLARQVGRDPVILTLDLSRPLRPERGDRLGLTALRARNRPTLRQVVDTLTRAADDERVVGLVARIGDAPGGLATVQELMAAVRTLSESGTPTVAHAETFGEGSNGTLGYLLATAFDRVELQPSGELTLLGLAAEVTFLRGALDRLDVVPEIGHRHEYKNAGDALTERGFTEAHRAALDGVVTDWSDQIVSAIADARHLDVSAVRAAIDAAPLLPHDAVARGLVDTLRYHDETLDSVRTTLPADTGLVPLSEYRETAGPVWRWRSRRAPLIALVEASGAITRRPGGLLAARGVSSDDLTATLRRAADDDEVAAIVLHVDSPGGSAVASDSIRRAVLQARDAGKPVVAWMGDVAASGGYYIAMPADVVIARPGALTGSIGVISGKVVTSGLEQRIGVSTEAVTAGAHARYFSSSSAYDEDERARLDAQLDFVYDDFTSKVAADRNLTRAAVEEVARGRIWTGAQARSHGLIDQLGGWAETLAATRALLDLADGAHLRVRPYPPLPPLVERLRGTDSHDPAERDVASALLGGLDDPGALVDVLRDAVRPRGSLRAALLPRIR